MSDYFERVERQLVRVVETSAKRRVSWPGRLAALAAAAVVVAVVAVFLGVRGRAPSIQTTGPASVAFTATGSSVELDRVTSILRLRLGAIYGGVHVTRTGNEIVAAADGASRGQIEALAAPGHLALYDWEARVLAPDGKTVASQLAAQNPAALAISQGVGGTSAGGADAGGMTLHRAVLLASRHGGGPPAQYYMFGARTEGHALLAGPTSTLSQLRSELPAGAHGEELVVPRGLVVLQAAAPSFGRAPARSAAAARFFVLRDSPALSQSGVTDPRPGHSESGQPNVQFGFTSVGAGAFRAVTAEVARRGAAVSRSGLTLNQHFAIALDGRLVTVPSIDFKAYPEGVSAGQGADVEAGFTPRSARAFATVLRYGPLPVSLQPR